MSEKEKLESQNYPLCYPWNGILHAFGYSVDGKGNGKTVHRNHLGVPTNIYHKTYSGLDLPIGEPNLEVLSIRLYLIARLRDITMRKVFTSSDFMIPSIETCVSDPYNTAIALINIIRADSTMEPESIFNEAFINYDMINNHKVYFEQFCATDMLYIFDARKTVGNKKIHGYTWRHPILPVISLSRKLDVEEVTRAITGHGMEELEKRIAIHDPKDKLVNKLFEHYDDQTRQTCYRILENATLNSEENKLKLWCEHTMSFTYRCAFCKGTLSLKEPEKWRICQTTGKCGWIGKAIVCVGCKE